MYDGRILAAQLSRVQPMSVADNMLHVYTPFATKTFRARALHAEAAARAASDKSRGSLCLPVCVFFFKRRVRFLREIGVFERCVEIFIKRGEGFISMFESKKKNLSV